MIALTKITSLHSTNQAIIKKIQKAIFSNGVGGFVPIPLLKTAPIKIQFHSIKFNFLLIKSKFYKLKHSFYPFGLNG